MFKRILPLVIVFALLIPFLVFPASAAVDYNDLITNIEVDGDNDIVTISVPTDNFIFVLYCSDTNISRTYYGPSFFSTLDALNMYTINVYAFGREYLDITNIPDGAQVTFDFSVSYEGDLRYSTPTWYTQISYRSADSYIGQNTVEHVKEALLNNLIFEMSMDKVAGAQMATFNLVCEDFQPWDPSVFKFTVNSLQLTFTISSLYRLQEQTGKTNEILSAVEKKLEQNGQKLDDVISGIDQNGEKLDEIINGEVAPVRPEGSDSIDSLEKIEDDLLNSAGAGLSDYQQYIDDSLTVIEGHIPAFAMMSMVFDSFINVGWLRGIFVISLSLGIFGYLVNIAFKAAGDAKSKSARNSKGGKGS